GIQVVGDHVNSALSAKMKANRSIKYHFFGEVMAMAKEDIQIREVIDLDVEFYIDTSHASITPHAPYSCSKELFKAIRKLVNDDNILSIHNQESEEENKLYRYREGEFLDFYEEMGIDASSFKAQARNSIQSYLGHL